MKEKPSTGRRIAVIMIWFAMSVCVIIVGISATHYITKSYEQRGIKSLAYFFHQWSIQDPPGFTELVNDQLTLEELTEKVVPMESEQILSLDFLTGEYEYKEEDGTAIFCLEKTDGTYLVYDYAENEYIENNECALP